LFVKKGSKTTCRSHFHADQKRMQAECPAPDETDGEGTETGDMNEWYIYVYSRKIDSEANHGG
jgi:hypothetical protein